jgi:C1A family cysteine protease
MLRYMQTTAEFRKLMLNTRMSNDTLPVLLDDAYGNRIIAPDYFDWRLNGSVTPVQDQVS